MKRSTFILWASVCAVGLIGCAGKTLTLQPAAIVGLRDPSIHILADRSRVAPVTGTFGWGYCLFRVGQQTNLQVAAVGERLQRAMNASFCGKGLTFSEAGPDLLVSFALASEAAIDDADLNQAYSELLKTAVDGGETDLHYKRGVLIVDVVERKSGHLLWRGAIMAEFDLSWPEERKQERCDAVIGELLRHYPTP